MKNRNNKQQSIVKKLSGKYKNRVKKSNKTLKEIKDISIIRAIKSNYQSIY